MPSTSPARIDDDLYASAKEVGVVLSRSASQQVSHWARIGRELEAGPSVSLRSVAEVLAGRASYDGLEAPGQALVRASWAEQMRDRLATLNLVGAFAAESAAYAELDADGNVVIHEPVTMQQSAGDRSAAAQATAEPRPAKHHARTARPGRERSGKPPAVAGDAKKTDIPGITGTSAGASALSSLTGARRIDDKPTRSARPKRIGKTADSRV